MKEIVIKLSDTEYNQLIYGDDGLDYEILEQAIVNGTPIPDNATNGEIMQTIFPNTSLHINEMSHTVWVGYEEMSFRIDWWNSPYQKGGK